MYERAGSLGAQMLELVEELLEEGGALEYGAIKVLQLCNYFVEEG